MSVDRARFLALTRDERIHELRSLNPDIGPLLGRDAADEIEALAAALEAAQKTLRQIAAPSCVGNYDDKTVVSIYRKWAAAAVSVSPTPTKENA